MVPIGTAPDYFEINDIPLWSWRNFHSFLTAQKVVILRVNLFDEFSENVANNDPRKKYNVIRKYEAPLNILIRLGNIIKR